MKKTLLILLILFTCSITAFAASYKVNTKGKVTTPTGQVQQSSTVLTQQNLYNNYQSQQYVNNQQVLTNASGIIDIVMDYSGSMAYWINAAKNSMAAIVNQLPTSTKVGFRVFGNNYAGINPYSNTVAQVKSIVKSSNGKYKVSTEKDPYLGNIFGSCSATYQVVPVSQYNAMNLINGMNSANVGGSTPLTLALKKAVESDFANFDKTTPKKIVLITDGGENCGGDPCAFAKRLVSQRKDITIDVVLVSSNSKALRCLASTTGGTFYNTNDISGFTKVLTNSMQSASQPNVTPTTIPTDPVQNYEFIGN